VLELGEVWYVDFLTDIFPCPQRLNTVTNACPNWYVGYFRLKAKKITLRGNSNSVSPDHKLGLEQTRPLMWWVHEISLICSIRVYIEIWSALIFLMVFSLTPYARAIFLIEGHLFERNNWIIRNRSASFSLVAAPCLRLGWLIGAGGWATATLTIPFRQKVFDKILTFIKSVPWDKSIPGYSRSMCGLIRGSTACQ
jgi:hypothetical protein